MEQWKRRQVLASVERVVLAVFFAERRFVVFVQAMLRLCVAMSILRLARRRTKSEYTCNKNLNRSLRS